MLVVGVPGHDLARMRAEAAVTARGWVLAASPAEADVLLTVGLPADELAARIDQVWQQVPRPRHRVDLTDPVELPGALTLAQQALEAGGDPEPLPEASESDQAAGHAESHGMESGLHGMAHDSHEMSHGPHDSHESDHGGHGAGGMGHGSMDMGHGSHGMDHGSMDMSGPGGVPLAGGFEGDRDGLEMDVLHLQLGPVLTDWPAGLALTLTLSGDVVVKASARALPAAAVAAPDPLPAAEQSAVQRLDRAQVLLRLAGWDAVAERTRRLRDALLGGASLAELVPAIERIRRRVAGSRLLAWNLRSASPATAGEDDAETVRRRLVGWLDSAAGGHGQGDEAPLRSEELAAALQGRSLAAVRLLVAAGVTTEAGSVLHA